MEVDFKSHGGGVQMVWDEVTLTLLLRCPVIVTGRQVTYWRVLLRSGVTPFKEEVQ